DGRLAPPGPGLVELVQINELEVAAALEAVVAVIDVGDPAAHARREVATGRPQHHHPPPGHVLAAVIADALDHRVRAGVAHREALAGEAANEGATGGGAVEHGVADDRVLLGAEQ